MSFRPTRRPSPQAARPEGRAQSPYAGPSRRSPVATRKPARLTLDPLEDRLVPTTLVPINSGNYLTQYAGTPTAIPTDRYAVGFVSADAGRVKVFQPSWADQSSYLVKEFEAYRQLFSPTGHPARLWYTQVYVAMADVTGDGVADVVTGTDRLWDTNSGNWAGSAAPVKVFNGATLNQATPTLVRSFSALDVGGCFVAAGDVTGDGKADVVVSRLEGGTSRVKVF